MNNKLTTKIAATLLLASTSSMAFAEEGDVKTSFYGSLRLGVDYVDAGTDDDAANGRDYLSRIGGKASVDLGGGLTGIGLFEYGLRGEDNDNFVQNNRAGMRQVYIGLKGDFGKVTYGSQTILWHKFVRGAYFSDGLDSLRQGAIRDDDFLQWEKTSGNWRFGAALQTEKQDGDSFDQYQLAAQYNAGPVKLQAALASDQRGDNNGNLYGVRAWYNLSDTVTLSAFYHLAEEDFDIYSGNSSGNVELNSTASGSKVGGVTACADEERSTAAIYGKWKSGKNQVHGRYALNSCDIKGDVSSIKVEYIRYYSKSFRLWAAFEQFDSDDTRLPTTGEDLSEFQLGARFDF
ncbi:porin [Thalassotalea sp. PLHSN55]|uniref:porin n=1 Tax=Thalassotalea sp. PLHSN55 TaxID=3435888 RepID=UPI003F82CEF3